MGAKNIRLQVHPEAKFCRCCGKPTERFTYGTYCTQVGCVEMGHRSREFCEHEVLTSTPMEPAHNEPALNEPAHNVRSSRWETVDHFLF